MVNTGASAQMMDKNTALEETKIRRIITAKDNEKPMAFKKRLFCQYKSYKEMCDKSTDLKRTEATFSDYFNCKWSTLSTEVQQWS